MSTDYYRDYERVPCRFTRVIAFPRESSSRSSARNPSRRASAIVARLHLVYPPKLPPAAPRSKDRQPSGENGYLPRNILATARLLVLDDVAAPVIHFRYSRKHSRVSEAHYYHTGPPCSGVLANKVSLFSFSFFLFPSLPSLFPVPFSLNADGYRVPLIRAFLRQEDPGGTEGQRTRRYAGSTRELCNLVTY